MKYTIDQYVVNLERMLEKDDPCEQCPWDDEREGLRERLNRSDISFPELSAAYEDLCRMCTEFIGFIDEINCPCTRHGKTEALKRTHLALEEYHEKP